MADKKLAEQNMRFILALHSAMNDFMLATVDEISRCERDTPTVNWDRFPDLLKRMESIIQIGVARQSECVKKKEKAA